jgi:hypothetical protein
VILILNDERRFSSIPDGAAGSATSPPPSSTFHHSLERGRIFAAAAEIILPTGKENEGLGGGVTVFEPFAAFGQLLPADGFIQAQTGFEIPFDQNRSNEFFWRGLVGKSFVEGNG